jgi:hypothetical protein
VIANLLKSTSIFFLALLPSLSFAQNYSCVWEARRSLAAPDWAPINPAIPIQGVVVVDDAFVAYGDVRFTRDRATPIQRRSNGSYSIVYRGNQGMFQMSYSPDGHVLMSLLRDDNSQVAGKCVQLRN